MLASAASSSQPWPWPSPSPPSSGMHVRDASPPPRASLPSTSPLSSPGTRIRDAPPLPRADGAARRRRVGQPGGHGAVEYSNKLLSGRKSGSSAACGSRACRPAPMEAMVPALQRSRVSSGMRVYANGNSGSRMHGGHVHNTWTWTWMGNAAHNVKGKSRVADFVPACIDWTGFLLVGYSGPISGPDYNRGGTRSTAGILAYSIFTPGGFHFHRRCHHSGLRGGRDSPHRGPLEAF